MSEANGVTCQQCRRALPPNYGAYVQGYGGSLFIFYTVEAGFKMAKYIRFGGTPDYQHNYTCLRCVAENKIKGALSWAKVEKQVNELVGRFGLVQTDMCWDGPIDLEPLIRTV